MDEYDRIPLAFVHVVHLGSTDFEVVGFVWKLGGYRWRFRVSPTLRAGRRCQHKASHSRDQCQNEGLLVVVHSCPPVVVIGHYDRAHRVAL